MFSIFTACFAKERNKGFFSLNKFHCSLKEEEAKAQILKAQVDEQNLLGSSNIDSLCVLLTARSLLHIKTIPVSIQALVQQTLFSSARPHSLFLNSFCWFTRKNSAFLWKWAEKCPRCISEEGLGAVNNCTALHQGSTWSWEISGLENAVRKGRKCV